MTSLASSAISKRNPIAAAELGRRIFEIIDKLARGDSMDLSRR